MIQILLSLFVTTSAAQAQDTYLIKGEKVQVYDQEALRITASAKCEISKNNKDCKNFAFLKKVSVRALGRTPAGNPNPGALICEDQLNGISVMGQDANENQRSFCYLSRLNLYIDNGTLAYYGNKNDGIYDTPENFEF